MRRQATGFRPARRHVWGAGALLAVAAGNGVLWMNRPTAEPVAPGQAFRSRPAPAAVAPAMPANHAPPEVEKPLDLTLSPPAPDPVSPQAAVTEALTPAPGLDLHLEPEAPVRPLITEDLKLFDPALGVRGVTRGYWISDHVRLRGGLGYTEDEASRDRDMAFGLGVDLAF